MRFTPGGNTKQGSKVTGHRAFQKTRTTAWDHANNSSGRGEWGDRRDSNPQQPGPQPGALPLSYDHHIRKSGWETTGGVKESTQAGILSIQILTATLAQNFCQFACVPLPRHIGSVQPTVVQHRAAIREENPRSHAQRPHAHHRKRQPGNCKQAKQTRDIRRAFCAGRNFYGIGTLVLSAKNHIAQSRQRGGLFKIMERGKDHHARFLGGVNHRLKGIKRTDFNIDDGRLGKELEEGVAS